MEDKFDFELDRIYTEIAHVLSTTEGTTQLVVGLQFPEGLVEYAPTLTHTIEANFAESPRGVTCVIFADVVYGACNIDDIGASMLGISLLIHFGHSQLVFDNLRCRTLYIPVTYKNINIDNIARMLHSLCAQHRFSCITVTTTAQFCGFFDDLQTHLDSCVDKADNSTGRIIIYRPKQSKLHDFEVLGCTCVRFPPEVQAIVSIVDGDFHLEAACLSNPKIPAFKLNPLQNVFEEVSYNTEAKISVRKDHIYECAVALAESQLPVGIVFGTLGHQGSNTLLDVVLEQTRSMKIPYKLLALSEVFPNFLFPHKVCFWVQLACPRLSLDWDSEFRAANISIINFFEYAEVLSLHAKLDTALGKQTNVRCGGEGCSCIISATQKKALVQGINYQLTNYSDADPTVWNYYTTRETLTRASGGNIDE